MPRPVTTTRRIS